jgi:hypothetical protein
VDVGSAAGLEVDVDAAPFAAKDDMKDRPLADGGEGAVEHAAAGRVGERPREREHEHGRDSRRQSERQARYAARARRLDDPLPVPALAFVARNEPLERVRNARVGL